MELVAHRGFWLKEEEKNTLSAFERAFRIGYGIETDLRDYRGKLVISHNIATEDCVEAECVFKMYQEYNSKVLLALNVKSDGIQFLLEPLLKKYNIKNYFLFDMSIPESVVNANRMLRFYTRNSDIEKECVLYNRAMGVWMDFFFEEGWLTEKAIVQHITRGMKVCIVSPELHGFDHTRLWTMLRASDLYRNEFVSLCTDVPDKAQEYFNE